MVNKREFLIEEESMSDMRGKTYKAKIYADATLTVTIKESLNGDKEIVEVLEVDEVRDFDIKYIH
jgi:hypothetical protein